MRPPHRGPALTLCSRRRARRRCSPPCSVAPSSAPALTLCSRRRPRRRRPPPCSAVPSSAPALTLCSRRRPRRRPSPSAPGAVLGADARPLAPQRRPGRRPSPSALRRRPRNRRLPSCSPAPSLASTLGLLPAPSSAPAFALRSEAPSSASTPALLLPGAILGAGPRSPPPIPSSAPASGRAILGHVARGLARPTLRRAGYSAN